MPSLINQFMFNKSNNKPVPTFTSRAEAFDYMFAEMCERGADLHDAAIRADDFANIIAKNRALPDAPEQPKNVIEKCVGYLQQITVIKRDHPEIWDLATGAIGGVIGAVVGVKASSADEDNTPAPPVDFNEIQ